MQPEQNFDLELVPAKKELFFTLSNQNICTALSDHASKITAWQEEDCIGKPLDYFIHPGDVHLLIHGLDLALQGEASKIDNFRLLLKGGFFQALTLHLVPNFAKGKTTEIYVLGILLPSQFREYHEERNGLSPSVNPLTHYPARSAYLEIANLLESLLSNSPVGFALLNEQLRFVCLNQTFSTIIGYSPEQQLGLPFENTLPEIAKNLTPILKDLLRTGVSLLDYEIFFKKNLSTIQPRVAVLSFYPLLDQNGGICGISVTAVDISERKAADARLKIANDEIKRSNEALEAFGHIASHDLKEPLRTISSFIQLLELTNRGKLDAQAMEYIQFALSGADRMRILIDGILSYSTAGRSEKQLGTVDCNQIVAAVRLGLRTALEEAQVTLHAEKLPILITDRLLLSQIFQNLIANAIKYRRAIPGQVHLHARETSKSWIFSVQDNGIGINALYLSLIFAPFKKLHPAEEYAGAGLGLAICRKNVERLGGEIWVTSEEGVGSIFSFSVPRCIPCGESNHVVES